MRYAIISDVHGNRQALNVVLTDIRSSWVDAIICLGDMVGYGPCPTETVESCYQHVNHFVLGNHDAAAAGKLSTENFNDNAKFLIDWTSSRLEDGHRKFISSMPLMLKGRDFRCAHASFRHPGRFSYIFEEDDARGEFASFPEPLAFVGHSHVPGIYVIGASGNPHWLDPTNFNIEDGKRYIVNVGSVGQPRDNDVRASYCIYDEGKGDILFRKIPFDIDAYRHDQNRCGLPEKSSYFVSLYLTNTPQPLREIVGFTALSEDKAICGAADLKNLEAEVKKLRCSRILLVALAVALLALSGVATFFYLKTRAEKIAAAEKAQLAEKELAKKMKTVFQAASLVPLASPEGVDVEIFSMPASGNPSAQSPWDNWIVELSDPETQKVSCEIFEDKKAGDLPAFRLVSDKAEEMLVKFQPFKAGKGMRFSASAQFKRVTLRAGHVSLCLLLEKGDGTVQILEQNTPDEIKDSDAWTRRTSVTIGKDDALRDEGLLYYAIKGNFSGEILVRKCSLTRKK